MQGKDSHTLHGRHANTLLFEAFFVHVILKILKTQLKVFINKLPK